MSKIAIKVAIPPSGKFHIAIVDSKDIEGDTLYSGPTVCGMTKGKTMAIFDDGTHGDINLGYKYACPSCIKKLQRQYGSSVVKYSYSSGQYVDIETLTHVLDVQAGLDEHTTVGKPLVFEHDDGYRTEFYNLKNGGLSIGLTRPGELEEETGAVLTAEERKRLRGFI